MTARYLPVATGDSAQAATTANCKLHRIFYWLVTLIFNDIHLTIFFFFSPNLSVVLRSTTQPWKTFFVLFCVSNKLNEHSKDSNIRQSQKSCNSKFKKNTAIYKWKVSFVSATTECFIIKAIFSSKRQLYLSSLGEKQWQQYIYINYNFNNRIDQLEKVA